MNGQLPTTEIIRSRRGTNLAVHHFGGVGPTLIISHATGLHGRCYQPMMPVLAEHFDVWALDFSGHGGSSAPTDDDFAWSGFASDLLAVIDHVGTGAVRIFGHSMGAASALLAAIERPDAITAAWLYEPIVFPANFVPRNSMMAEAANKRRREFDSKADALMRYASRPPLGTLRADALAAYVDGGFIATDAGTVTLACAPEHEAATFNNARLRIDELAGLELRVTIASGAVLSEPGPAQFARPIADAIGGAELRRYEDLGHFGPLQAPDRIATHVSEFLR